LENLLAVGILALGVDFFKESNDFSGEYSPTPGVSASPF
jgi:hypothetical protein